MSHARRLHHTGKLQMPRACAGWSSDAVEFSGDTLMHGEIKHVYLDVEKAELRSATG